MGSIWLNAGCQKEAAIGFFNIDIVEPYGKKWGMQKDLPFSSHTVGQIYSENYLGLLTPTGGLGFLRECRRVLKPGGVMRIALPDLDDIIRRYLSNDWRDGEDMPMPGFDWAASRCEMLNMAMRESGQMHVYNEEELIRITQSAGLEPIRRCIFGESDTAEFVGCEKSKSSRLIMEFAVPDRTVSNMPLVSVLIPAYNAAYFRQAFQSALAQTYKNIEIIICDDSANNDIHQIMNEISKGDERIKYQKNEPSKGGVGNYLECFSLAQGEFIKYLNDDDLLAPECIDKMLAAFRDHPDVTLVTSYRRRIDRDGNKLEDVPSSRCLTNEDSELEGVSLANVLVRFRFNIVGEPTTVMFRRKDLVWVRPHYMYFGGAVAVGAGDVAMWLYLLGRGNAFYITEALSSFRIHPEQGQNRPHIQTEGLKTWERFRTYGKRIGFSRSRWVWFIKARKNQSDRWEKLLVIREMVSLLSNHIVFLMKKAFCKSSL